MHQQAEHISQFSLYRQQGYTHVPLIKTIMADLDTPVTTYLKLAGTLLSGWQMARALLVSEDRLSEDPDFYSAKIGTAYFYAEHLLSQVPGMASAVINGGRSVNQLRADQF